MPRIHNNVTVSSDQFGPQTVVSIALGGNNSNNNRRASVNTQVTFEQLGITEQALETNREKPDWSQVQAQIALIGASRDTSEVKMAKTQQAINDFNAASQAFQATGSVTVNDVVMAAVREYLIRSHGFSATANNNDNAPYIRMEDLACSSLVTGNGVTFLVTGTSVWG
jgi:hypothetical protein